MGCPYYVWKSDYFCLKKDTEINEDLYSRYCKKYEYTDCPIYRYEEPGGKGCYLTSACVEAKGLLDDCIELTTLRRFRDTWLNAQPGGKIEIEIYYNTAPRILSAIQKREDNLIVLEQIYQDLVLPCVQLIQENKMDEAWKRYRAITEMLIVKYCFRRQIEMERT